MKLNLFYKVIFIIGIAGIAPANAKKLEVVKLSKVSNNVYHKIFPNFSKINKISIEDTVSSEKNNKSLYIVYKKSKIFGFARYIETSTGCNTACLPFNYTSFYSPKGEFLKINSISGLTKKNHIPFSSEDYAKLNLLIAMSISELDKVTDPLKMTDALSGATLKSMANFVVPKAAYTTLRVHKYNQETVKYIQEILAQAIDKR